MADERIVESLERPGNDEGKNLAVLAESIAQMGWGDPFLTLSLGESKAVRIKGTNGAFMAKGPGVLFVAFLPAEAFEKEQANEGIPEEANAEPDEGLEE